MSAIDVGKRNEEQGIRLGSWEITAEKENKMDKKRNNKSEREWKRIDIETRNKGSW